MNTLCEPETNDQLANMLKAVGHPLRIQLMSIVIQERMASIPTLQSYLADIDHFVLYSNLRFMQKKKLLKKLRKGREIYYSLSETAIREGMDTFFRNRTGAPASQNPYYIQN